MKIVKKRSPIIVAYDGKKGNLNTDREEIFIILFGARYREQM